MTAPVSQVLSEAADLLAKPGAWTQGAFARGKSGRLVERRQSAACFCAVGAVSFIHGADPAEERISRDEANYLREAMGIRDAFLSEIFKWNDAEGRTQEEVVAAFRRAAALAKEQGR